MKCCRGGRAGNVSMTLLRGRNEGMSKERGSDSVQTLFFVRAGFFVQVDLFKDRSEGL